MEEGLGMVGSIWKKEDQGQKMLQREYLEVCRNCVPSFIGSACSQIYISLSFSPSLSFPPFSLLLSFSLPVVFSLSLSVRQEL